MSLLEALLSNPRNAFGRKLHYETKVIIKIYKCVGTREVTTATIYLLTYMGVFGLDFVIELLLDKATKTHNPYTILNPYHM